MVGWRVDHPDVDVVRTSDELGMTSAVQHLVELGHRRIAHLQGGSGLLAIARRDAYMDAMRVRGLGSQIQVMPCDGEDQIDGQHATRTIVTSGHELPTALIAFNDDIAVAAINVLTQQGIDVPGDISVVGFDDSALASGHGFDLTSVQQTPREMAQRAVARLVERSNGAEVKEREIVFDPELIVRSTSGPTARHEPDTAAELVADLGVADRAGGTLRQGLSLDGSAWVPVPPGHTKTTHRFGWDAAAMRFVTGEPGGTLQRAVADTLAEASGRDARENPVLPGTGGPAGNALLTAWTALVLLVVSIGELLTLFDVRGLISWHVALGALLVPPAAMKTASTTWRMASYYLGSTPYREAGPPPLLMRLLGPLVVLSTLGLLGTGVLLVLWGRSGRT